MAWFKIERRLGDHPAAWKAGNAALGLWVRLGCWLTTFPDQGDVIPRAIALRYGTRGQVQKLVDAELLLVREGGDYTLNPSMQIAASGLPGRSWVVEQTGTRRGIPAWLRKAVYDRDGRACLECGSTTDLSLDHIYPYSLGGEDTFDNLRTLCRLCNSRKGARV